mgnify:CR=1 FL=1
MTRPNKPVTQTDQPGCGGVRYCPPELTGVAEPWTSSRQQRGGAAAGAVVRPSAQRVRRELQQKGVSAEAVVGAMDRLRETEEARAREVWRKRFGAPATDAKERAKQIQFLIARGFAAEVVRRVTRADDTE